MAGAPTMSKNPIKNKDEDLKGQDKTVSDVDIKPLVAKFVGKVENLHEINIHNVFDDKYRVNVWVKWIKEGMFGYSYEIAQSYFMKFSDGELTDLTKATSEKPLNSFL